MKKLLLPIALITGVIGFSLTVNGEPVYPLTVCVVSGDGIDSKGEPYVFVYEERVVKLCTKECKSEFDKDPEKFIQKLEAATAD